MGSPLIVLPLLYRNAWPPLQEMIVTSLEEVVDLDPSSEALIRPLILELVSNWVRSNFIAFEQTGLMFEKYDADKAGQPGKDGEYVVQKGFGWSNGVILHFLYKYGQDISFSYQVHLSLVYYSYALIFLIITLVFTTMFKNQTRRLLLRVVLHVIACFSTASELLHSSTTL